MSTISFGTFPGSDTPSFHIFMKGAMSLSRAVVQEDEPRRVLLYAILRCRDGTYTIQFLCNGQVQGQGALTISAPPAFIVTEIQAEIQERLAAEGVEEDFRAALSEDAMSSLCDELPLLCKAASQVWESWQDWVREGGVSLPDTMLRGTVDIALNTFANLAEA